MDNQKKKTIQKNPKRIPKLKKKIKNLLFIFFVDHQKHNHT